MEAIRFEDVYVLFGPTPRTGLDLLDRGADKDNIYQQTENIVAVQDANLSINRGEICVLMGLSGSGKSSLLRCINRLNHVNRGRVLVRNNDTMVDIASCGRKVLHAIRTKRISMVFQQFALMPWRTVWENVSFGLELSGVSRKERDAQVRSNLEMVKLDEWADKYPSELSGGMQQRVGLARALATDADILLMDEPFSALDPLIREHLQDELLQLQKNLKKTIVFVSHDLDEALKLGNQVSIMESGRIVQTGTAEDIILNPADDYVRQFVGSMNPLKALNCNTLMRPVMDIATTSESANAMVLDSSKQIVGDLDDDGRLVQIARKGEVCEIVELQSVRDISQLSDRSIVTAGPQTSLQEAVEVNHHSGMPMVVLSEDNRLVGLVGKEEIMGGIAGDTGK
ncbi:MAG: choline ABC transporter ATP-binding protein [Desulforhopalus sp.]